MGLLKRQAHDVCFPYALSMGMRNGSLRERRHLLADLRIVCNHFSCV